MQLRHPRVSNFQTPDPSAVIPKILAAALSPDCWFDVLNALAPHVPGGRVHLIGIDRRRDKNLGAVAVNYDEERVDSFLDYYQTINPRTADLAATPLGRSTPNLSTFGYDLLSRTEYYNDWMKPQEDCYRGGGIVLARTESLHIYLGCDMPAAHAERAEAPFNRLLDALSEVLMHAVEVNRRLHLQALEGAIGGLAPSQPALLFLDASGRVLRANPRAEGWLARGRVIGLDRSGRLRGGVDLMAAPEGQDLSTFLKAARRGGPLRAVLRSSGRCGYEALVVPLADGPVQTGAAGQMFVGDLAQATALLLTPVQGDATDDLARRLGLTAAEAEVCRLLAAGQEIPAIAASRGTSEVTVRNQIKSASQKLGTGGRAGLIRKVLTAPLADQR